MVRAQNQFTKIREKEELIGDLQEKSEKVLGKMDARPAGEFFGLAQRVRAVLRRMAGGGEGYGCPSYAEFFSTVKLLLVKGVVCSNASLVLAALRQWGPVYKPEHYTLFAFLLVMAARGLEVENFERLITEEGIKSGEFLKLIGKEGTILHREEDLEELVTSSLV